MTRYQLLFIALCSVLLTSLWPNNIYLLFGFSIICWVLIPITILWDDCAKSLLIFSFFYFFIQLINGNEVDSRFILGSYLISPVAFYRFGRYTFFMYRADLTRQKILLLLIFTYLCPVFIATIKDIQIVGIINESRQLLGGIPGGKRAVAATIYGLMTSVGLGCVSVIYLRKQTLFIKVFFIMIAMFSLLTVIHLVNRTGLVVITASLILGFLISSRLNVKKMFFAFIILSLFLFVFFNIGLINDDLLSAYSAREEDSTYDASSAGGRTDLWYNAINTLLDYPFGVVTPHYAHNLWLDIARVSGFLALIPFGYSSLIILKKWLDLIRYNKTNTEFLIIIISFSMLLNASVEPTIEGSMLFFSLLMLVWGMVYELGKQCSRL